MSIDSSIVIFTSTLISIIICRLVGLEWCPSWQRSPSPTCSTQISEAKDAFGFIHLSPLLVNTPLLHTAQPKQKSSVPHNIFMAWKHRHHLHYTHKITMYFYITMFFQSFTIFNELQCAHYSSFARQASSSLRALCRRRAERQKLKFQCFSKRSFLRLTKFHQLLLSSLPWYLFCHRISHQYCHLFQKADSSTEKERPPTPILKSDPKKLQEWSTTILRLDPKNYHIWQVTLKCFTRVIQTCCQVVFLHYNVPPTNVNSCDL